MGDRDNVRPEARIVAVSGCLLGTATILLPSFVLFRPNRVFDGTAATATGALGAWAWVLAGIWVAGAALSLTRLPAPVRGVAVGLLGGAAAVLGAWRIGAVADAYLARHGDVARLSLGAPAWLLFLAAYVVVFASTAWVAPGWRRAVLAYAPIAGVAVLLAAGSLSSVSIMREYAVNAAEFGVQFRRQLAYVAGATGVGAALGIPLGVLAARRPRSEPAVFGVLNVLNVLPVLAFVGLLNPVLEWLSARMPVLAAMDVRPVGWAPVLIVLSAYAMYPIARNAHSAITTLDPGVVDAARGMGMGRLRRMLEVELPLAAPVILAGIRVAIVQTTAGAIIAGLVGGGGLGTFVFLGASQSATDLILVGVVPIVALGLFFDRSTLLLERLLRRWSVPA